MREPVERLKKKVQRENLWLFILCILSIKECHGFELRGAVKERFGFLAGNVTAYKVLYMLKKGGYVSLRRQGNIKYYRITEKGRKEIIKARKFIKDIMREFGWM